MKLLVSILIVQLSVTAPALGQMPGMANPSSPPPDESNATTSVVGTSAAGTSSVTFTKDVARIVQQHCQSCHSPGEGTPFSMPTYEDAKPWAKLMRQMVQKREMPPWSRGRAYREI